MPFACRSTIQVAQDVELGHHCPGMLTRMDVGVDLTGAAIVEDEPIRGFLVEALCLLRRDHEIAEVGLAPLGAWMPAEVTVDRVQKDFDAIVGQELSVDVLHSIHGQPPRGERMSTNIDETYAHAARPRTLS
jgi:hypothetical protein